MDGNQAPKIDKIIKYKIEDKEFLERMTSI